jgi:pimeloyl-ACP methyl ester carboxylesterase
MQLAVKMPIKGKIRRATTSFKICHSSFPVLETMAPDLVAQLVKHMLFAPPRISYKAEDQELLQRATAVEYKVDNKKIFAYVWGEGRPVLLVHGWGGTAGHMARLAEGIAGAGFKAVAIDMPGHGSSQGCQSSFVEFARAMQSSAAIFGPYFGLVAHSFGAAAATYAMSRSLKVDCAIYLAPFVRIESYFKLMRKQLRVADQTWERALAHAEFSYEVRFDSIAPLVLATDRSDTPLLIIHDPKDEECSFPDSIELAYSWPGAILRPIDSLGNRKLLKDHDCIEQVAIFLALVEEELHLEVPRSRVARIPKFLG